MLFQLFAFRLHFERYIIKKNKSGFKRGASQKEKDNPKEYDGLDVLSEY
jgi:hypothetical protein